MSEFRKNPVTGRWVIIAPERNLRPHQFGKREKFRHVGSPESCPFCPGNEKETPPEVYALRKPSTPPDSPGWEVRVVPNKYPILDRQAELRWFDRALFKRITGFGYHEVIIETTDHYKTIPEMEIEEIEKIFFTYQKRLNALRGDKRIKYVIIFKNHGEEAGASISHSHSQLLALPFVPPSVEKEIEVVKEFYLKEGNCALCLMLQEEMKGKERIVEKNEQFVAFIPFASDFPFEVWIAPRGHSSSFENLNKEGIRRLAEIYRNVLRRVDSVLERPCYNAVLHTAPFEGEHKEYFHWYLQIIPQITRIAGFEMGSGILVNVAPPEQAADFLRRAEWKK